MPPQSPPIETAVVKKRIIWKRPLLLVLLISLGAHVLGGLILGGIAIFNIMRPVEAEIEVLPPPEATRPEARPYQARAVRNQRATTLAPPTPLTVDQPSDFPLPSLDVPMPDVGPVNLDVRGQSASLGMGLGDGVGGPGFETLFGNTSPLAGALRGVLIDFKQNTMGRPTGQEADAWLAAGRNFVRSWDVREFRRYFQAPQPLYSSHFYIPMIQADEAPRAFGVEGTVEPRYWIAVYQGQFRSREGGTFRFAGTGDDILMVGVNRNWVFSGGFEQYNPIRWRSPERATHAPPRVSDFLPPITYGEWFDLPAGQPVDITVVVGEMPGGEFASYLFIEQRGVEYRRTSYGRPVLPIFKLRELSRTERERLSADGYEKDLDGPVFGFF
jgi:hypothetical protein